MSLKNYILGGLLGKSMRFYANYSPGGLVAKSKRFAAVSEQVIDEMVLPIIRSVILVLYLLVFTSLIIPQLTFVFMGWVIIVLVLSRIRLKYDLESSNADPILLLVLLVTPYCRYLP
jgi:ABC-type bacteriocin/lantibiotic exporter with double-glycine peptidase domain